MTAGSSEIRQLVEDHLLALGAEFDLLQHKGPVFEVVFHGELSQIDLTGLGVRLFTWPTFSCGGSVVRFSGNYKGGPVLIYVRSGSC